MISAMPADWTADKLSMRFLKIDWKKAKIENSKYVV